MRLRCSVRWCLWRAKYIFDAEEYGKFYECWFHGGDIEWLEDLWWIIIKPIHFFYSWIKYSICLNIKGLKWKWRA